MEETEKKEETEQGQEKTVVRATLLVCAICGAELHPEMARVLSFEAISQKIGRRVSIADLVKNAFCKHHQQAIQEEVGDEITFGYLHALAALKRHAQQDEEREQERAAVRAFLPRVVDERGGKKRTTSEKRHWQKEKKSYHYLPASDRDRGHNS